MDETTAIKIYKWLDDHLDQQKMNYIDWLADEKERLDAALLQTSDQLTDANERIEKMETDAINRIAELQAALDDKNDLIGSLLMEKSDLEAEWLKRHGLPEAPCPFCGYNGAGYYDSEYHSCVLNCEMRSAAARTGQ